MIRVRYDHMPTRAGHACHLCVSALLLNRRAAACKNGERKVAKKSRRVRAALKRDSMAKSAIKELARL